MRYLIPFSMLLLLTACAGERAFPDVKNLSEYKHTDFVTTPQTPLAEGKNSVYCTTLLLAWQQVKGQVAKPTDIPAQYPGLVLLNDSKSFENTLKEDEYEATVGVDAETGTITARAEFSKALPFELKLKHFDNELKFKGKPVDAFGMKTQDAYALYEQFDVLYYKSDEDFIVRLIPVDKEHEIILCITAKKPETLDELFHLIDEKKEVGRAEKKSGTNDWKFYMDNEGDELLIPKINFNIETNYRDLEGNSFTSNGQPYMIEKAYQRIAFLLDEAGAEIESEAEMTTTTSEAPISAEKPHPKKLHFNKPFLVMLKRTDSPNPYFAMWVENTELLRKT